MKTLLPILKTKLFLLVFVSGCTVILATTIPQIKNFIAAEKPIGEKITTEQKRIVLNIKKQNRTVSSSRVTSGLSLDMNNSFEAIIQTDKLDYSDPNGVDTIKVKIYNKNTLAIVYNNQPGAPDNADPTTPVFEPNTTRANVVVASTPTNNTSADLMRSSQMEAAPLSELKFDVKAFQNPSEHVFSLVLENATNEKVQIVVYDALGRQVKMFEKQSGNIPIHFGMDLKVGVYVVEVRQGDNRKTLKLVKQ